MHLGDFIKPSHTNHLFVSVITKHAYNPNRDIRSQKLSMKVDQLSICIFKYSLSYVHTCFRALLDKQP